MASSDDIPLMCRTNTFSLRGRIKRQAFPYALPNGNLLKGKKKKQKKRSGRRTTAK